MGSKVTLCYLLFVICLVDASGSSFFAHLSTHERAILEKFGPSLPHPSTQEQFNALVTEFKGKKNQDTLIPLVLIPSLIGNGLDAKLEGSTPPHWYCSSNYPWFRIFLDAYAFYPIEIECFKYNIQLFYDAQTSKYSSPPGVTIDARDFGNLSTSAFLDASKTYPVWNFLIELLVSLGYQPGISLRSAPYDWRIGPDDGSYYRKLFANIQNLIEDTYKINGNTKVAVTSLSMGGGIFNLFLSTMSQPWKDTYMHSFIPLSSCFAGSAFAPVTLLGLESYGIDLTAFGSNWGTLAYLFPYQQYFSQDQIILTPQKNYTVADLYELFIDAKKDTVASIFRNVLKTQILTPPGIPTYCVIGTGIPTLNTVEFLTENWPNGTSVNTTVPGDGTCSHKSLDLCRVWATQQKQPVRTIEIPNMEHGSALNNPEAARILLKVLFDG